ncbi:MAG: hypothetical protein RR711_10680, partial [Bacteroides sp.]
SPRIPRDRLTIATCFTIHSPVSFTKTFPYFTSYQPFSDCRCHHHPLFGGRTTAQSDYYRRAGKGRIAMEQ